MWSSKELLIISIATGLVFCFATLYAQNAMTTYVNRKVAEKTGTNPLIGTGLVSNPQQQHQQQRELVRHHNKSDGKGHQRIFEQPNAPPGSGTRWTPIPT